LAATDLEENPSVSQAQGAGLLARIPVVPCVQLGGELPEFRKSVQRRTTSNQQFEAMTRYDSERGFWDWLVVLHERAIWVTPILEMPGLTSANRHGFF
jgi:hypothetical protein